MNSKFRRTAAQVAVATALGFLLGSPSFAAKPANPGAKGKANAEAKQAANKPTDSTAGATTPTQATANTQAPSGASATSPTVVLTVGASTTLEAKSSATSTKKPNHGQCVRKAEKKGSVKKVVAKSDCKA